nr:acyloxyacyl hydrolase [Methylobacterium phyllosphaerae]
MPASAADAPPPPAAYLAPVQPLSIVSEIRIGGAVQDPGSAEGKLPGFSKANVNGEILFAKPILSADPFWQAFVPRPTVGGSYNTGGRTSYAYLGATWTLEVFPETFNRRVFLDGFFGGVAHNGWTGPKAETPYGFNTLGCSPMFREAAALGFRITEHWSIMATIEHMSNAGLCANNRGLTNYGGKIGYTF